MSSIKKLGKMFLVNCLWILFSLPIITVGASTCAAFSVCLKLVNDDDCNIWSQFVKGFKQSWLQGILMGIVTAAFSFTGVKICSYIIKSPGFLVIVGGLIYLIFAILINFFAFALIARYSNTFVNVLKNSISIFIQFFKPACKCVILTTIEVLILVFAQYAFYIPFLFMPAVVVYTISITARECFEVLEERNQTEKSE